MIPFGVVRLALDSSLSVPMKNKTISCLLYVRYCSVYVIVMVCTMRMCGIHVCGAGGWSVHRLSWGDFYSFFLCTKFCCTHNEPKTCVMLCVVLLGVRAHFVIRNYGLTVLHVCCSLCMYACGCAMFTFLSGGFVLHFLGFCKGLIPVRRWAGERASGRAGGRAWEFSGVVCSPTHPFWWVLCA